MKDYDFDSLDDFEDIDDSDNTIDENDNVNKEEIDLSEYEPEEDNYESDEEYETLDNEESSDDYESDEEENTNEEESSIDEDDKFDEEYVEEDDDNNEPSSNKGKIGIIVCSVIIVMSLITLFALKGCSKNKTFTIKFDSVGGTPVSEQKVKKNGKVKVPNDPTKEGYDFVGWYVGNTRYDFDSKVTKNLTIVAKWDSENAAPITGVTLDQTSVILAPGATAKLVATLKPENAKSTDFTWTSSNPDVVSVDSEGTVTAIKEGTALITVATSEGGFTSTCAITVSKDTVNVTGISLNKTDVTMSVNGTDLLVAVITPEDATNKGVLWSSSDSNIVSVSEGKLTAKKGGTVTITAETKDGGLKTTARVIVKDIEPTEIKITNAKNMNVGDIYQLDAVINPLNASNKDITWSSSAPSIVSVDSKGTVRALSVGNASITASTSNGKKYTVQITVSKKVVLEKIEIKGCESTMKVGDTLTLSVVKTPYNAEGTVVWSASNRENVSNGKFTPERTGEVTITASLNGLKDTCTVNVEEDTYAVNLKLNESSDTDNYYSFSVTKNGSSFTDYSEIKIGNNTYSKGENIPSDEYSESIKTATVVMRSGTVTASISVN